MSPLLPLPVFVTLRWMPGTMHLVQFTLWGRTFVLKLSNVTFKTPHTISPLYLFGSVRVSMVDVRLSVGEQQIFDDLARTVGRDNVVRESPKRGGGSLPPALA